MSSLSSPDRSKPVKITYSARQKRKKNVSNIANSVSQSESESTDNVETTEVSAPLSSKKAQVPPLKPPSNDGPKKIDFRLPGPSPRRVQRDGSAIDAPSGKPLKSLHARSSSSITSLNRVESRDVNGSPFRKKPVSVIGVKTSKMSLKREMTPESEMDVDDGASVAESSLGIGRIRRTEAERIEYFKNQPDCGAVEEHRALCNRCRKFVSLGRRRAYTVRPWEIHREKCDQKPPSSLPGHSGLSQRDDDLESDIGSTASSVVMSEAERKSVLDSDPRAEQVKAGEVLCRKCHKWIRLSKTTNYALYNWTKHQQRCSGVVPSSRVATAERKLRIVNDSQAKSFDPKNVECALCGENIPLQGEGDYNLTSWEAHKKVCKAKGSHSHASSSSSTDSTLAVSDVGSSPGKRGLKRSLEEPELAVDDPDARPQTRPRTEKYQPPQQEAPGPLGWFLLPFKAFVRGFKESMKAHADHNSS